MVPERSCCNERGWSARPCPTQRAERAIEPPVPVRSCCNECGWSGRPCPTQRAARRTPPRRRPLHHRHRDRSTVSTRFGRPGSRPACRRRRGRPRPGCHHGSCGWRSRRPGVVLGRAVRHRTKRPDRERSGNGGQEKGVPPPVLGVFSASTWQRTRPESHQRRGASSAAVEASPAGGPRPALTALVGAVRGRTHHGASRCSRTWSTSRVSATRLTRIDPHEPEECRNFTPRMRGAAGG